MKDKSEVEQTKSELESGKGKDIIDEWRPLLTDEIGIRQAQGLIREAQGILKTLLSTDPHLEGKVSEALRWYLRDEIKNRTWGEILDSMKIMMGEQAAYLFAWAAQENQEARLKELEDIVEVEPLVFLRNVVGGCRHELARAYSAWNRLPDDWIELSRDVFYDTVYQSHRIRIRIRKYNDEECVLEGPPDSIVDFVRFLMDTLSVLGTGETSNKGAVTSLVESVASFARTFEVSAELASRLEKGGSNGEDRIEQVG